MKIIISILVLLSNFSCWADPRIDSTLDPSGEARKQIIQDYENKVLKCRPVIDTKVNPMTTGKISCDDNKIYVEYSANEEIQIEKSNINQSERGKTKEVLRPQFQIRTNTPASRQ